MSKKEMKTTTLAAIALAGLALAACTRGEGAQPNITVNTGEQESGIAVSGTGEVTGTPDTVTLDLGVSVLADTVSEASTSAAAKAEALIAAFTGNGVPNADITTTNYSIWPEYRWDKDTQILIGYRVNNTVRVKIRDIASTGDMIDQAVAAGGDEVTVSGLSFSIEDDTALIETARQAAWEDARSKAEQLATLSGQQLGAVLSIRETVTGLHPPIIYDRAFEEAAGGTPIEPGTSTVTISLDVRFSLEA